MLKFHSTVMVFGMGLCSFTELNIHTVFVISRFIFFSSGKSSSNTHSVISFYFPFSLMNSHSMLSLFKISSSSCTFIFMEYASGLSCWSPFSIYIHSNSDLFQAQQMTSWGFSLGAWGIFLGHKLSNVPCSMVVSEPITKWLCICDEFLYPRMV